MPGGTNLPVLQGLGCSSQTPWPYNAYSHDLQLHDDDTRNQCRWQVHSVGHEAAGLDTKAPSSELVRRRILGDSAADAVAERRFEPPFPHQRQVTDMTIKSRMGHAHPVLGTKRRCDDDATN